MLFILKIKINFREEFKVVCEELSTKETNELYFILTLMKFTPLYFVFPSVQSSEYKASG